MNKLAQRLFDFSVRSLKLTSNFPNTPEFKVIRYQLAKSATSSGANYEEAQAGSSRADFTNKIRIALREMRESNYWLRTVKEVYQNDYDDSGLDLLIQESKELKFILGAIITKMRKQ
ncbi:MAG: four helix bundle protein [Candidatus Marinimicrobia bacterium]|nr:four helix bundle protein [Candidatus Neomarinimicrobiota bacterium]